MTTLSGVSTPVALLRLAARAVLRRSPIANHARPLAGIVCGQGGRPSLPMIARSSLAGRSRAGAWIAREGGAEAIAAAGRMEGRGSWQVTQLLAAGDAERGAERVLERVSAEARRSGAQRIFLRLPAECELLGAARRAGYFPVYYQTLMIVQPRDSRAVTRRRCDSAIREASRRDEYELFRLYNTAVPSEVRRIAGVTFDQWRDSREPGPRRTREFVLEGGRRPAGLLSVGRRGPKGWLSVMAVPEAADAAAALAAYGLDRLEGARRVRALVAEFQPDLQRALTEMGFAPGPDYVVCVHTTGSAVRLAGRAEARA